MKRIITAILILATMIFAGCGSPEIGSNEMQSRQTEQMVADGRTQTGMPAIVNFQELKLAKMIYELRDTENLICYAYIVNLHGELIYVGECVGYGLPYSVQFSNPERIDQDKMRTVDRIMIPQPEPNGLFMPEGLSATWIMLIDPTTGEPRPVYFEPTIVVSPFPLH